MRIWGAIEERGHNQTDHSISREEDDVHTELFRKSVVSDYLCYRQCQAGIGDRVGAPKPTCERSLSSAERGPPSL